MDLPCFHSRSRLKIRRGPSCKISSSQTSSASFHGSCAAREMKKKGSWKQPLIFHTFEPEIILTEPAEFMSLVQRLTGSAHTRRLVRTSMRKAKEMQSSSGIEDEQLIMQQGMHSMHQRRKDPLKEGSTIILAPTYPNPNDDSIKHAPELPLSSHANNPPLSPASSNNYTPLAAPLSSDTIKNHPSSSLSSNSAISEENPFSSSSGTINMNMSKESSQLLPLINPKTPLSSSCLHDKNLEPSLPLTPKPNNCKSLIIDNNQISPNFSNCVHTSTPMSIILPLPAKASDELSNTSRGPPWSPVSPNSSLTTSSEGEHTDNLSTEGGASTYREAIIAICREEEGNTLMNEAEEDGMSSHFFVFSGDSYYGSSYEAAQDDELEFQYSNVLDSFSMHSEALSFFKDNTLEEEAL